MSEKGGKRILCKRYSEGIRLVVFLDLQNHKYRSVCSHLYNELSFQLSLKLNFSLDSCLITNDSCSLYNDKQRTIKAILLWSCHLIAPKLLIAADFLWNEVQTPHQNSL
jgi:hypothetical protein